MICSLTVMEENIHQGSLIIIQAPRVRGLGGCMLGNGRPHHSVCDCKSYGHQMTLWLQDHKNLSCGLRILAIIQWSCMCVRLRKGRVKETQMLRFPFAPEFHVHYKSVQSKVNVKTLQINPESDRSSVSCLWYHFPSKWYGWGSDNCHPDLASLHHSPKTLSALKGGWDEITNIHNIPCLS